MPRLKPTHIETLVRLIVEAKANVTMPPDCREAAMEELQKYIEFDFDNLDELRARWNLLSDDEELAEKRVIYDLSKEKAEANLARCKARLSANITYGRELKKILNPSEGGQNKAE